MLAPSGTETRWRDVQLDDIAILVPARTSLPYLGDALEAAGIPYRAEASSLVYRTREVRHLLMAARAADDPSDAWWNILAPVPDALPDDHPVWSAVALSEAAA